jgi:ankyrin repeat protein
MNVNTIKNNISALFVAMTVAATGCCAQDTITDTPAPKARAMSNQERLFNACTSGNLDEARSAIESGAKVNPRRGSSLLLHAACKARSVEVCQLLITHGVDVHAKTAFGVQALHAACEAGSAEVCQLLITHGADVDARDSFESTPLHYSIKHQEVIRVLIQNKANCTLRNSGHVTAYDQASPEMKDIIKKEIFWRERGLSVWMASDYAPPNLLKSIPEDVARYITSMYL